MDRQGYVFAAGAHLLWGLLPVYWKQLRSIPAGQLTALRFVQTLVIVLGFLWIARQQSPRALLREGRSPFLSFVAGSFLATNWLVFVYAVSTNRVVDLSLGYFISPLVSVLLGMVFLGERLNLHSRIAVGLSAMGVGIIAADAGSLPWISLVVATAFGLYGLAKKLSKSGPIESVATEMIWATPFAAGYLVWLSVNGAYETGDAGTFALTFLIGVVTALPLLLFARAAQTVPLWGLGLMQYLGPSVQFFLGVMIFGEAVTPTRMTGFAVIWGGLMVFAYRTQLRESRSKGAIAVECADDNALGLEPC